MKCNRPLYFVLTECHLMDDNGQPLGKENLLKLWELYNLMVGSTLSTLILRGESNENLRSQFDTDANNLELLAKFLFMVGEKGRICWSGKEYLDPDDVSSENFKKVCASLAKYIREGYRGNWVSCRTMWSLGEVSLWLYMVAGVLARLSSSAVSFN